MAEDRNAAEEREVLAYARHIHMLGVYGVVVDLDDASKRKIGRAGGVAYWIRNWLRKTLLKTGKLTNKRRCMLWECVILHHRG